MSEIRATTISDAAGTGPITLTGQSAAKAYWRSATTYTLGASFNVSSMVDNSTGNYNVSFTNAFASSDDIVNTFGMVGTAARFYGGSVVSASEVTCRAFNASATANDTNGTGSVHGDLA